MAQTQVEYTIPGVTKNPNNGSTGNSRLAGILRAAGRKKERHRSAMYTRCARGPLGPLEHVCVTLTRVAPSQGLDPHDGLGAALKGTIDGIADALGLRNDRDPHVTWVLAQKRGETREYAVDVCIRRVEA